MPDNGRSINKFADLMHGKDIVWTGLPKTVRFSYLSYFGEKTRREVDVNKILKERRSSGLYLHGFCRLNRENRIFEANRINGAIMFEGRSYGPDELLTLFKSKGMIYSADEAPAKKRYGLVVNHPVAALPGNGPIIAGLGKPEGKVHTNRKRTVFLLVAIVIFVWLL